MEKEEEMAGGGEGRTGGSREKVERIGGEVGRCRIEGGGKEKVVAQKKKGDGKNETGTKGGRF